MNLIDTHAHLDSVDDIDGALERAKEAGVSVIVAVGEDKASNEKNMALASRSTDPKIILALGLHPGRVNADMMDAEIAFIEEHIREARAIGEIGLDFWYQWVRKDEQKKQEQRIVYRRLLELAKAADVPAVVHTRGAWREAFDIARDVGIENAVFHWYSGPVEVLEDILKAGYFISASPSVAYSPESRRALEIAPVEQTLIETDSPVYYKHLEGGLRAEPKDVAVTLRYYAALKAKAEDVLAAVLNANAKKLFGL